MLDEPRVNARRARVLLGALIGVAVLAGALLGTLLGAPVIGAVTGAAAGVGAAIWLSQTSTARALRALGARPLADDEEPRLQNLIEGLALTSGVPAPALCVTDAAGFDVALVGRGPRDATLVFGRELLAALDRIELEGVVAHLLVRIRSGEHAPATLAAAFGPLGDVLADRLLEPDRITRADVDACQLTRYPPGLIAALEKLHAANAGMTHARPPLPAHLWFAPAGSDRERTSHPPLDERIALLREL